MNNPPLLEVTGLSKRYPGTIALDNVGLTLCAGEIHCLMGENGAGKSTLIKILAGAVAPDKGSIKIDGVEVGHTDLRQRRKLGISVIYQDLNLIPQMTVAENIFLGHEPRTLGGMIDHRTMIHEAQKLVDSLGVPFSVTAKAGSFGVSLQQLTACARALSLNGRILIMDEPSAVLSGKELDLLFDVMQRLKAAGIGIIYISHRLDEVFRLGDRLTVLRDGQYIATRNVSEVSQAELIRMMVGRVLLNDDKHRVKRVPKGEVLRVEGLTRRGVIEDITFSLGRGEVLGIAGLVGAGRTEVARAIVGLDPIDAGTVFYLGQPTRIQGTRPGRRDGHQPRSRRPEGRRFDPDAERA